MQWVETENDKLLTRISRWHHMTSWSSEPCLILLVSKGFCTSPTLISIWLSGPSVSMFSRFVATKCRNNNNVRQILIKFKVCVVVANINKNVTITQLHTSDWLTGLRFYWKLFIFNNVELSQEKTKCHGSIELEAPTPRQVLVRPIYNVAQCVTIEDDTRITISLS